MLSLRRQIPKRRDAAATYRSRLQNVPRSSADASLFDLQVNGFFGVDFQSPDLSLDGMRRACEALRRHGTGGILFTLVTDDVDQLCRKFENIETIRRSDSAVANMIRGYHLEGPWISTEPGYHGAHPAARARKPESGLADYRRIREAAGGNLRLITLAPEVDGCPALIEQAVSDGIRVALGHTNASSDAIDRAIRAGATLATHLGNAVPAVLHRHDNVVQRLLARDELIACVIPDGLHLPPFVLKNFVRAKMTGGVGLPRVFFTTDCMSAAGKGPGRYTIGPHVVDVGDDGIVRLPGDSRFAGSSLTMDRALQNVVTWLDLDEASAQAMCSTLPAAHFGIEI